MPAAAQIYLGRAAGPDPAAAAWYNLGTALLTLDAGEAERRFRFVIEGGDSAATQRSHYNLGFLFLSRVDPSANPDSVVPLLLAAIAGNRAALRLAPGDQSARWNLALAQRLLDSLGSRFARPEDDQASADRKNSMGTQQELLSELEASVQARGSSGEADDGAEREADTPQPGDAAGLRAPIPGGESEALAGEDPGVLTQAAARRLLRGITDPPEQLVRGLLWSHRPNIAWWRSEQFPGGNW